MGNFSTNLNLEMPFANERYNIGVFNANTAKIDEAVMRTGRREYIVSGMYAPERYRRMADVCCDTEDGNIEKVQALIDRMNDGDILCFSPGVFIFRPQSSEGLTVDKQIRITGCGYNATSLMQEGTNGDIKTGAALFTVKSGFVIIENMLLSDSFEMTNEFALIDIAADSVELRNLFFMQNIPPDGKGSCVRTIRDTSFSRIENCRIYRTKSSPQRPMLNFGDHIFYNGVIGSFIISGSDYFSIKFKNDDLSKQSTSVYACAGVEYL